MPELVWDKVGDRSYESGLDKGVLYLPDGSAVPWNGLTSVIEKFDKESVPVYYDGMKISDLVTLGSFAASMKAVTYPDEFVEIEGVGELKVGLFLGDQPPKVFGLCYRTKVGNDLDGADAGYKIHILYNVTAIPNEKTYLSLKTDPSLVEFEWDITAVPEEVPGFRPTAHIIVNSLDVDPWLLEDLEAILYGDSDSLAVLIPMTDLITFMTEWYRVKITDNGDGTWTAISQRDGFISFLAEDLFQILHVNSIYLDQTTYTLSSTLDISDIPEIKISDDGNGSWFATTDQEGLISVDEDGIFTILDANVIFIDSDSFEISDTIDD